MFGPNVTIATAGHPILPELREKVYQYNASVRIGRNCWLGAGVVVLPGVTIGDNAVVAAGSVVIRDVPPDTLVAGNPARVIRKITAADRKKYRWAEQDKEIFQNCTVVFHGGPVAKTPRTQCRGLGLTCDQRTRFYVLQLKDSA